MKVCLSHCLIAIVVAVCCFSSTCINAQTDGKDSVYADQLYVKSKPYWGVNKDSALFYLKQSEELSDKLKFKRGKAYSLYGYGVIEEVMHRQFVYYTKSLELFQSINDQFGIGLNLVRIGYIYEQIGESEKALNYYQQALSVKKKINDFGGIALVLINIGSNYRNKGEIEEALKYYEESLIYRRKAGEHRGIGYSHANIAEILLLKNKPAAALSLADSAVYHFSLTNDVVGKIMALTAKGNSLLKSGKSTEAESAFQAVLELPPNNSAVGNVLYAKKVLADIQLRRGDLKKVVALQSEYIAGKELKDKQDYRTETQRLANEFEFRTAQEKAREATELEAREINRRNNLENLIIAAMVMVVFVILFSGRRKIPASMANAVLFIGLLLLFEFLLVLTDSFVEDITGGEPILKLLSNVLLALMILPVHQFLEKYIQKQILKPVVLA